MYSLKAVITVEYGKERQAALDIGDTIYPYDETVKVSASRYGGVLLLYSNLTFNEIIKLLRSVCQPHVVRILKVDACCQELVDLGEISRCILDFLKARRETIGDIRIYERGCIKKIRRELIDTLRHLINYRGSDNTLHVIPVDFMICLGIMKRGEELLKNQG